MSIQANAFRAIGGMSARLPRFRGKHRAFLALFSALGLKDKHVSVVAQLQQPVPFRARLDLHSWLQRLAYVAGEYEADTVRLLLRLGACIGRPGYLLDVGANIGLIGIPFALLAKDNHEPAVIAVEAVPDNAAALRENIRLNAAEHLVHVISDGVGEKPGTVKIQVEGDLKTGQGTGTANILATGSTWACETISINITTLDALMDARELPPKCTVVKIDTDGYDLKVLEGGIRFLAACRPVIFGEFAAHCMNWHGQSLSDVVAFASTLNYEVWPRLLGKQHLFTKAIAPEAFIQDLLLVPRERAESFDWCLG